MKYYEADRINPKIDQWNGDIKKFNDFQYRVSNCSLYAGRFFTVKYFLFQGKTKQTKQIINNKYTDTKEGSHCCEMEKILGCRK